MTAVHIATKWMPVAINGADTPKLPGTTQLI